MTSDTLEATNIGIKLRELREEAGLSLRDLGVAAGVAASYLSSLERGGSSPTLATLRRILVALGTTLEAFFAEPSPPAKTEVHVFRREHMRAAADSCRRYTFLLPRRKEMQAEMLDEYLLPGEREPEFETLESAISGVVLAGILELDIHDAGVEVLRPGDAFHIPAEAPHRGRCISSEPVRLITVFTPPTY